MNDHAAPSDHVDPEIDRLALALALRRSDLSRCGRRYLAAQLAHLTRAYGRHQPADRGIGRR